MNSRDKGARGEREAAAAWVAAMGGSARRGQQFCGSADSPDVVTSFQHIHLEVKRTERGNPYVWLEQAIADAGPKVPVVLHKRNRREWLLIMRLEDAPRLCATEKTSTQAQEVGEPPLSADPPVPGVST